MSHKFLKPLGGVLFLLIPAALLMLSGKFQVVSSSPNYYYESEKTTTCSENEDVYLGDGAYAVWGGTNYTAVDISSGVPSAEVILFGADELYKTIHLKAVIEIGHIQQIVLERDVELQPLATVSVPIVVNDAFSLHARQNKHVTRLCVEMSATYEGAAKPRYFQNLPLRYLAMNSHTNQYEIMSAEVKNEKYPYGLLDEDELQEALLLAEDLAEQGIHLDGVGSGVEFSTNDAQQFAEFLAHRTINQNELEVADE
ncbi:MAG TPA: hypothetical protein PK961_13545 [bacterium]|nr:hypothetical protein [bacterium]